MGELAKQSLKTFAVSKGLLIVALLSATPVRIVNSTDSVI